ncbi:MAG: hypothetical protein O3A82_02195 [Verrucomicrobia bacterium]|nr:hypothetical protein [Verrucomicrobiota bacterium]MDA1045720.1 hypothetical protein [Verrucomicrobiota bacterium]
MVANASPPQGNFETQFSWIRSTGTYEAELRAVEAKIEEYFSGLQLPDRATIYDYLVLGLRGKDLIATFNWDPFLMEAHRRNRDVAELPDIRFLHGSVNFATCPEHDVMGVIGERCPTCSRALERSGLFFPDDDKDYTRDEIIIRDWNTTTNALASAFHLTIFGYGGPRTDFRARKLILDSWNESPSYDINHVEIIDKADYDHLVDNWREYFPHHHSLVQTDFWDSSVARWPRRTTEWKSLTSLYGEACEYIEPPRTEDLAQLQAWFADIAQVEPQRSNKCMESNG